MKWLGAFVLGLLAGVLAGFALLYVNPLSGQKVSEVDSTTLLSYELGPRTLSFTHGQQLGFDLHPRSVPALWESTIRRTMMGIFVLDDLRGEPAAIASRTMKLSPRSNPLLRGVVIADNWLVTVPGAGTYFIESEENLWPLLRDTAINVNLFGRQWEGERLYELSIGPDARGAGRLTGASGRFADVSGTAVHSLEVSDYRYPSQLQFPVTGQLRVDARRPGQAATAQ